MATPFEYVVTSLKLVQKAKEPVQAYLNRVVTTISALPESNWEKLPEDLQVWYNAAAEIVSSDVEDEELPDLPGYVAPGSKKVAKAAPAAPVEPEVEEDEVEDEELEGEDEELEGEDEELEGEDEELEGEDEELEEVEADTKPAKPAKVKKEKVAKAPKEPKVKKEKAPPKPKREGPIAADVVRDILCDNMDLTIDQTMEILVERGVAMKRSSLQVNRPHC